MLLSLKFLKISWSCLMHCLRLNDRSHNIKNNMHKDTYHSQNHSFLRVYCTRDANLRRSKIWRLSFFTNPLEFQRTPTPTNWPSPQWEWLKNAPETVLQIRKIEVLSLNWAKSRNKAQKSSKDDFIREIWWPVRETGRSAPYRGDSRIIRESWRVCCTMQWKQKYSPIITKILYF